ncbi:MAG: pyruvate, phosphate dikinase, partial [Thauera phenolivorans]|nr:pyruvate, phosphate dikinase [Thauera phenolivorans]
MNADASIVSPAAPQATPAVCLIHARARLPADAGPATLGAKAWNLARMAALGLPVPPAFVLGTAWCADPAALAPTHWQAA